jgi:hypothetical protein
MTFVKNRGEDPIQDSPVKESTICLFNENTTPDPDSTETELTLLKFRLDQNQSCPHTSSRSQSRRTLVISRHCFSSSDRRWPHTTTLFDANRSQSWAALSGLREEKDAIFLLVSYRPSHYFFTELVYCPFKPICTVSYTIKSKLSKVFSHHHLLCKAFTLIPQFPNSVPHLSKYRNIHICIVHYMTRCQKVRILMHALLPCK